MVTKAQQVQQFWSQSQHVNDMISQAQSFLLHLEKSPKTQTSYYHHLRYFIEWCHTKQIYFATELNTTILSEYKDYVAQLKNAKNKDMPLCSDAKQRRILHVDIFLKWLVQNNLLTTTISIPKELPPHKLFWHQSVEIVSLAKQYMEFVACNYNKKYTGNTRHYLRYFLIWCQERGINACTEITAKVIEVYQNQLTRCKSSKSEKIISATNQKQHLLSINGFCKWLKKHNHLKETLIIDYPKIPKRLPAKVLTHKEVKQILAQPDTKTALGLRDRAILEILYSTGIRRNELVGLNIEDINTQNHTLHVKQGKYGKDRIIPIGKSALKWTLLYLQNSRETFYPEEQETLLFVHKSGKRLPINRLNETVTKYIRQSGISEKGSCHMFRHSMATGMLEQGAEIRYIQEILGHSQLETTEIYTRISIAKLKDIHNKTHPARMEPTKNIEIINELEQD